MPLDFRNCNTLWTSLLVQTLQHLGLTTVVICPGSRSAPLAFAFSQHPELDCVSILDERSAAFFAVGRARRSGKPVALVCTSGTAGANFYPAVIEARESGVPLLILTADRPPELRQCHAGQAIDQTRLFGAYATWDTTLDLPSTDLLQLQYLRQTLIHAWERSQFPQAGPVHLNCPFRDPLHPQPDPTVQALAATFPSPTFFAHLLQPIPIPSPLASLSCGTAATPPLPLLQSPQFQEPGLIIVVPVQTQDPKSFCATVTTLAKALQWPVLADVLNPLRHSNLAPEALITTYDLILRNPQRAEQLATRQVIQIGELPTSKELRQWLARTQPQRWVVDPSAENLDPLHGPVLSVRCNLEVFQDWVFQRAMRHAPMPSPQVEAAQSCWLNAERRMRGTLTHALGTVHHLSEPKLAWNLAHWLPLDTTVMIANSTPVRDWEWFCLPHNRRFSIFFNRGANGIDGLLSTALGIGHGEAQGTVLVTGDLALLHDTNGFLLRPQFQGHLTILLINNQGGGIFELLPLAAYEPPFESYFATPQSLDFSQLCQTYGVEYHTITQWADLPPLLQALPPTGIRLLEVRTDRKADAQWRHRLFEQVSQSGAEGS